MALDYLHRVCKVIHTDIKPENVVLQIHDSQLDEFVKKQEENTQLPISMKFLSKKKSSTKKKKNKKKKEKNKVNTK